MLECTSNDSEASTRDAIEKLLHAADRTTGDRGTGELAESPGDAS